MAKAALTTIALKRQNPRRYQRLFIIVILSGFIIWSISPLWQRLEQKKELNELREQMSSSKSQENQLKTEIKKLQNDQTYLELMARQNLGMIKPDEESYVVVETDPAGKEDKKAKSAENQE